jgi:tRNA (guanine-N7-)-methyltransferase
MSGPESSVRPARPHTGRTPDGRRLREVVTYSRRGSRLTDRQAEVWQRRRDAWFIPDEAADTGTFDPADWFGRPGPLVVEIGSGIGEATVALAAGRPEQNVLAFEVWRPGVAETFHRLERAGAGNVRLMGIDAVWSLEQLLEPASVAELWSFFPDPWPKKRHHRRRLVTPAFASVAASRLAPGGLWRLATDWPEYAAQMMAALSAEPALENVYDGPAPRWDARPMTRFERRGVRAGRPITDLLFRRRGTGPTIGPT